MKRTVFRLLDLAIAVALVLVIASLARVRAAEWPTIRASDTLWPGMAAGSPQWPNISAEELAQIDASIHASAAPATAVPAAPSSATLAGLPQIDADVTGALAGPRLPAAPATFAERFASPFTFEAGARYWYSVGQNRFAFSNNAFPFGNPTSTLDWDRMQGHSGEAFFRIDHQPTHLYVKGVLGGGILRGGDMDDVDFLVSQINFSNTTSQVNGNFLAYGIIDLGYSFDVPSAGVRYGVFVGFHYWREHMTASGLLCNATLLGNPGCPAGALVVPLSTSVDVFNTTWNAFRIGGEARYQITDRFSISGEIAFVPYAWLTNQDSHLLRADLGPTPNIISRGTYGIGGEVEAFLNYKVLPHFDIGAGIRYWGLYANSGSVDFGPTFTPDFSLVKFSTQRYGLILQAKATF